VGKAEQIIHDTDVIQRKKRPPVAAAWCEFFDSSMSMNFKCCAISLPCQLNGKTSPTLGKIARGRACYVT